VMNALYASPRSWKLFVSVTAKRSAKLRSELIKRGPRSELIAIDELGYVSLAEVGAELLFQVIGDRA